MWNKEIKINVIHKINFIDLLQNTVYVFNFSRIEMFYRMLSENRFFVKLTMTA